MAFEIKRASKKKARLRMAIAGATGAGKTYTAIKIAKHLIGEAYKLPDGQRSKIVVIDTERNSAELYADEFDFEHLALDPTDCSSKNFKAALLQAEQVGEVVILDSITHEWKYCLSQVDILKPRFGNNTWSTWSVIRPPHDDFVDTIMASKAHVIATMRSKMATAQEKGDNGKTTIRQVGLESIQADDLDYSFSIVLDMDKEEHSAIVRKTRCSALDGKVFQRPGEAIAGIILNWLNSGEAVEQPARVRPAAAPETPMPAPAVAQAARAVVAATVDPEASALDALTSEFIRRIGETEGAALKALPAEAKRQLGDGGPRLEAVKAAYFARVDSLKVANGAGAAA